MIYLLILVLTITGIALKLVYNNVQMKDELNQLKIDMEEEAGFVTSSGTEEINITLPDISNIPLGTVYEISCKDGKTPIKIISKNTESLTLENRWTSVIFWGNFGDKWIKQRELNQQYENRKNEFLKIRLDMYITDINKENRVKISEKTVKSWLKYIIKWVEKHGELQINYKWLELTGEQEEDLEFKLYENNVDLSNDFETETIIFSKGNR